MTSHPRLNRKGKVETEPSISVHLLLLLDGEQCEQELILRYHVHPARVTCISANLHLTLAIPFLLKLPFCFFVMTARRTTYVYLPFYKWFVKSLPLC